MSFKDIIRADIGRTFLNIGEFADCVKIDNNTIRASFQTDTLKPETVNLMSGGSSGNPHYVATGKLYMYCDDYGKKPKPGKIIFINDRQYKIVNVADECGMFIFDVEAVRA